MTTCSQVESATFSSSTSLLLLSSLVLLATLPCAAQGNLLQGKLAAVKQSMAQNEQRLSQYQWIETTQLTLRGDQKPPTQDRCYYGPDGRVQKIPIGAPPEAPSGGRLKRRMIRKKEEQLKEYMGQVHRLLRMYLPPNPQKMDRAREAGNLSLNPLGAVVNLVFVNYAQPGDRMTLTFDPSAKKIVQVNVNTYLQNSKDAVTLRVQMASLPDGTNYLQQTVLSAKAKEIVVTTTNSNYVLMSRF